MAQAALPVGHYGEDWAREANAEILPLFDKVVETGRVGCSAWHLHGVWTNHGAFMQVTVTSKVEFLLECAFGPFLIYRQYL